MAEREGEELQAGPWGDERTQARLFHFGCRLAASLARPLDDADPLPGYWGPVAGVDLGGTGGDEDDVVDAPVG